MLGRVDRCDINHTRLLSFLRISPNEFQFYPQLLEHLKRESSRDNSAAIPTATFVLGHWYQDEVTRRGWMCLPWEGPDRLFRATPPRHIPRLDLLPETFLTRFITARRVSVEFHN